MCPHEEEEDAVVGQGGGEEEAVNAVQDAAGVEENVRIMGISAASSNQPPVAEEETLEDVRVYGACPVFVSDASSK